ncbi:hypothetical protein GCM10023081_45690 [Arthrobacter ginkgonis]|uniref:Uncharacterized protein n=1 Tax=Arthrobacter ginkgonis TaxID=1630594 RepID=A0ABP7DHG3_9MICC
MTQCRGGIRSGERPVYLGIDPPSRPHSQRPAEHLVDVRATPVARLAAERFDMRRPAHAPPTETNLLHTLPAPWCGRLVASRIRDGP